MCVYLYITNIYTINTLFKQNLIFWMRLTVINHLTAVKLNEINIILCAYTVYRWIKLDILKYALELCNAVTFCVNSSC